MIEKALWASSTYASEAKVEVNDGYEMVKIPITKNHDKHLAVATKFLSEQGIYKSAGRRDEYENDFAQVMKAIRIIDLASSSGGDMSPRTEVEHWAYFEGLTDACLYAKTLLAQKYEIKYLGLFDSGKTLQVRFTHIGTMQLCDISPKTMWLARQARKHNGDYDGWEITMDSEGNLKPAEQ